MRGAVTNPRHVLCEPCQAGAGHTAAVRETRGRAIAARKRAPRAWKQANPGVAYDPELFTRDILPKLQGVLLREIVEATGCSKAYATDIRRGKWTPHVWTWQALGELAGVSTCRTTFR